MRPWRYDMQIRTVSEKDAAAIAEIYRPYVEKTAITFEYDAPDEKEMARRIRSCLKRYPWLVAEESGKIIGYAYASAFKSRAAYDWSVETSIYVDEDRRLKGTGQALYAALESILTQMGILNVNACIAVPGKPNVRLDKASVYFHEHMGYDMVGIFHACGSKFGQWYDMCWMEKHLGNHDNKPEPVTWFCDLLK